MKKLKHLSLVLALFVLASLVLPVSAAPLAAPGAFGKINPINVSFQPINPILRWGGSSGAQGYSYCYYEASNNTCTIPSNWVSVTGHSVALPDLENGHTYYWQVRAFSLFPPPGSSIEADGGAWWSFYVDGNRPSSFSKTSPSNGSGDQPGNTTLTWTASTPVDYYVYCVDAETVNNSICDSGWVTYMNSTSVILDNLLGSTFYYWQVRAYRSGNFTEADGGAWSYFVARTPGTYTVTNNSPDGSGSLAQTVREAVGGDVINFADSFTIHPAGTITINKNLVISPSFSQTVIIDGDPDHDGTGNFRLFTIGNGAVVSFAYLTLTNGYDASEGGAVYNLGNFTANSCTFTNNKAHWNGGAVYNAGTASFSRSSFSMNSAQNYGGAIRNYGDLTVEWTTFTGNTATDAISAGGSAIYNDGRLTVKGSIFSSNTSAYYGGAIDSYNGDASSTLTITNSTFYNNSAKVGGAFEIRADVDTLIIKNSTIVANTASNYGGGIHLGCMSHCTLTLQDSIVSANPGDNCRSGPELVDGGGNLNWGDLVWPCPGVNVNPLLGVLKDNGGPVWTMAPALGSPAIDASSTVGCEARDARGVLRPQGAHCDIGAVEVITISGTTHIGGVTLSYNDGGPQTVTSVSNGSYQFAIPFGWSGTVIPSKANIRFSPDQRSYSYLEASQVNQDYVDLKFVFLPLVVR